MHSSENIITEVNAILVQQFELEPDAVRPEARLREELDLDSLDAADLLIAMEKRFQVRIDDQAVRKLTTVGEIHTYVRDLVSRAESGAAG